MPPYFLVLSANETDARRISGLASQGEVSGQSVFYHPEPVVMIEALPALLRSDKGIVALDGLQVSEPRALSYEKIGNRPKIKNLGRLDIIQSELGVFILNKNLSVRTVNDFPVDNPWPHEVSIDFVEAWRATSLSIGD